jgi:hypothetical protein
MQHSTFNVNKKDQLDASVCRHLFTATSNSTCFGQFDVAVNKCLHTDASSWSFLLTMNHDARNHVFKKTPLSLESVSLIVLSSFTCIKILYYSCPLSLVSRSLLVLPTFTFIKILTSTAHFHFYQDPY